MRNPKASCFTLVFHWGFIIFIFNFLHFVDRAFYTNLLFSLLHKIFFNLDLLKIFLHFSNFLVDSILYFQGFVHLLHFSFIFISCFTRFLDFFIFYFFSAITTFSSIFIMPPWQTPVTHTNSNTDSIFYIHLIEGPSALTISLKINGSNYLAWSQSRHSALGAMNELAFFRWHHSYSWSNWWWNIPFRRWCSDCYSSHF